MSDGTLRPTVQQHLRQLQPGLVAALLRQDHSQALRIAYGALDVLAREMRPPWADTLSAEETLVQAILVEVERRPLVAYEDMTLGELDGTAVWLCHKAWVAAQPEATALTRRLAATLGWGDSAGQESVLRVSGVGERAALWTQAWM